MNNLEDRDVIILGGHCEECGVELGGASADEMSEEGPVSVTHSYEDWEPFPVRYPVSALRREHVCDCGGRIVFDLMGAAPEDPDGAYADYQDKAAER